MAKDYAKNIFTVRKTKKSKAPLLWAGAGLTILLSILIFVSIAVTTPQFLSKAPLASWPSLIKNLLQHKPAQVAINKLLAAPKPDLDNDVRYDFYTDLPAMHINVATTADAAAPPASRAIELKKKPASQYIVQLGAFVEPGRASQLRLSLLLAGIETDIVQDKKSASAVYRVQQGPFDNENFAKIAQRKLEKKGVDSLIKPLNNTG